MRTTALKRLLLLPAILSEQVSIFRSIVLLLAFLTISPCATAEEYTPTTDKEILFRNIPWGETTENVSCFIQDAFPVINSVETDESTHYGFSDPTCKISEYVEAEQAEIVSLKFEYISNERYDLSSPLGCVAGYKIHDISMRFLKNDGFGLFEAEYNLGINNNQETYIDLKNKLSDLYGIPYEYEKTATDFTGKTLHKNAVWIGADNTAIYLVYEKHYTGPLSGCESVRICYGSALANAIIERLEAEETALEEQAKEESQSDYSGL